MVGDLYKYVLYLSRIGLGVISLLKIICSGGSHLLRWGRFSIWWGSALYSKSRVQIVTASWYNLYAIFSCSGCTQSALYGSSVLLVGKNGTRRGALGVFIFCTADWQRWDLNYSCT